MLAHFWFVQNVPAMLKKRFKKTVEITIREKPPNEIVAKNSQPKYSLSIIRQNNHLTVME